MEESVYFSAIISWLWSFFHVMKQVILWLVLPLGAAALILWFRERWLYKRLNGLLDSAISGNILGETFNESRYSQLENKLYQYLKSSSLSRRQLEADRARIAEMVSDISHQTKTPITNILLYAQLLQEGEINEENRELVEQIVGQSNRLKFLVEALVKASRLETGLVTVTPRRYPLTELFEKLKKDMTSKAEANGVELIWEIPEGASCRYDPKWTNEALENLIDNAIKYTHGGGKVEISVLLYEMFCRIDVVDYGIGILESEQAHVFERFYRSPRVAQQEGVGIGLYLARQIIGEEGGYIKLKSNKHSTVFSVFLPR